MKHRLVTLLALFGLAVASVFAQAAQAPPASQAPLPANPQVSQVPCCPSGTSPPRG